MLDKVNKIRDSINTFDDAKFVSLISENMVLIKNTKNNSEWTLNFNENEGLITYDGENAERIKDGDKSKQELFENNAIGMKTALKSIFDKDSGEDEIKVLKEKIFELPFYEEENVVIRENATEEDALITKGRLDAVSGLYKTFKDKVKASDAIFYEFAENGFLFDKEGEIKDEKEIIDPAILLEAYGQKKAKRKVIADALSKTVSFQEAIRERYDNEDVIKTILETIEPKSSKASIQITKALVTAKTKFDSNLVLADERKFLTETYEKIFTEDKMKIKKYKDMIKDEKEKLAKYKKEIKMYDKKTKKYEKMIKDCEKKITEYETYIKDYKESMKSESVVTEDIADRTVDVIYNRLNAYPRFKFLKFRTNIYERHDVEKLSKELENVLAQSYHSLDADELTFVNELYTRVMYMSRTNQIDDELVTETIKSFNKRFQRDNSADFRDPDKALGWHGLQQSGEQNAGHNPAGVEGV